MKTLLVIFPIFSFWIAGIGANPPADLSGAWINELESQMLINHTADGRLEGKYCTIVEAHPDAGGGEQDLYGAVGKKVLTTFAFSVSFKDGVSSTGWSGQYKICKGKEILLTSWMLTSHVPKCGDIWMATRVGQDKFVRKEKYVCKVPSQKVEKREDL